MASRQATVSARADVASQAVGSVVAGARAEHISLESQPEIGAAHTQPRKVRAAYELKSSLRGCVTQLSILEDHFISVRSIRPRIGLRSYVLDLRFVNSKPVRIRRIAWAWLMLTLVFSSLTGAAAWLSFWTATGIVPAILTGMAMFAGAVGSLLLFLRRTTESLEFTSAHGNATFIEITAGIGSARAGKSFFIDLIKNINAAKRARQQPKQAFLCDEMREHHRLRELGVLTERQYETSKARILAAHQ